jgi:hypothetical protein
VKGLEISRRFFLEWGLPFLQQHFPRLVTRLAAGKIGGSDCLGADDALSRDHDWGPVFMLWMDEDDHREYGPAVRQKIDEQAPDSFLGYSRPDNSYVAEIHSRVEYFDHHVGIHVPPESGSEWMPDAYGEEMLYDITHGSIYYDPAGRFTSLRRGFAAFAGDPIFRLRRLVDTCFGVWHFGEYNFRERIARREDAISLHICLAKFIENVMRQGFYLNNDYCPYWKWLHHEFLKIPGQQEVASLLDALIGSRSLEQQTDIVDRICRIERGMICADGIVEDPGSAGLFDIYTAMQQKVEAVRAKSPTWWNGPGER